MDDPMLAAKSEAAKQAVILLFAIITMVVVMAATKPDFLRTLRMRLAAASGRLLAFSSRRAGHISMGIELETGHRRYRIPYQLSLLRDKMQDRYERECGSLCLPVEQPSPVTTRTSSSWMSRIKALRVSGSGAPGQTATIMHTAFTSSS
jgi:hypothetical protein